MIKKFVRGIAKKMGLTIKHNPANTSFMKRYSISFYRPGIEINFQDRISKDPLNAALHLQYGVEALKKGKAYLSYAELKMAVHLGAVREVVEKSLDLARAAIPKPEDMNHNGYFRLTSLASELALRDKRKDFSVLDVGGGEGMLASFIPEASYCLADPSTNGISGINLPFSDNSFDYVVSCHVLEHIPVGDRNVFLDQLLSKSKCGVILLNPFYIEGTYVKERLQLFIEIADAQWAREHLECTLPKIEDIKSFAEQRGLSYAVKPNGTLTTSIAIEFMNFFASKAGLQEERERVNKFFNMKYEHILNSADYPVGYLIFLGKTKNNSGD
ncbi:MAG: class I SAM-dependent methyltransferase [Gallionella sp.]